MRRLPILVAVTLVAACSSSPQRADPPSINVRSTTTTALAAKSTDELDACSALAATVGADLGSSHPEFAAFATQVSSQEGGAGTPLAPLLVVLVDRAWSAVATQTTDPSVLADALGAATARCKVVAGLLGPGVR